MSYKKLDSVFEALEEIPDHRSAAGIRRVLLLKRSDLPGKSFHIAAHLVNSRDRGKQSWEHTTPHTHSVDELSLLIANSGELKYRFEIDGGVIIAESPCAILIPAGRKTSNGGR